MPHPLQTASLTFGLVNIPVKLFTAASSKAVAFHLLHKSDGSRVQQHLYCPVDRKELTRKDIVKGYEVSRNHYVQVTDEEIKAMEAAANRNVEIQEFVPLEAIDPVYFEKTYYLSPDKGGEKPYRLLAEALAQRKRGAVAQLVLRGKENLVLIRPVDKGHLALDVMYYADEVRDIKEIEVPQTKLKEAELKLAEQLIEGLFNDKWQPEKYHDTYRQRLLQLIKRKQKGEEVVAPAPARREAPVIDLMDALKKSLARGGASKATRPATRAERKERRRRAQVR
jgi:DNA end-binding protein Ku